jgi:hypothetical protein
MATDDDDDDDDDEDDNDDDDDNVDGMATARRAKKFNGRR